jgi:hypothetical protein
MTPFFKSISLSIAVTPYYSHRVPAFTTLAK